MMFSKMSKAKIIIFLILSYFLSYFFVISGWYLYKSTKSNAYFKDYKTIYIELNKRKFLLYVVDDSQKREKGLSSIKSIKNDQGMIFVFDKPDYYSFWMKDMQFPLDFIFVKDTEIIDLIENVKPETFPKTFTSKKPADKVIEVNSGIIKNLKIKIGDEIKFFSTPSQN